jgi:predicted metal-dependent HD superfamily phosphohydrolase
MDSKTVKFPPPPPAEVAELKRRYWAPLETNFLTGAWDALDARYSEPHRAFHNWRHIIEIFERLEQFARLPVRRDVIAAAAFWHDAVYLIRDEDGVRRSDLQNVSESADLFRRYSQFPADDDQAVLDLIMATADHVNAKPAREAYLGHHADFDLFLDLDLGSLAAPWDKFIENLGKLGFEYMPDDKGEFLGGQLAMLTSFARADISLYRRSETRATWGETASANIARCICELRRALNQENNE